MFSVVLLSVVLFTDTYVSLISFNFDFPSLLNSICKYIDVPLDVVLYNTFDDFILLLSNNTSLVSLSIISNFPTVFKFPIIVSVLLFSSGISIVISPVL